MAVAESRLGNSIGVPLPEWVIKQLEKRSSKLSESSQNNETMLFKANRSAWTRVVSSVDIATPSLSQIVSSISNSSLSPELSGMYDKIEWNRQNHVSEYFFNNYGISIKEPNDLAKQFILQGGVSRYNNDSSYTALGGLDQAYNIAGNGELSNYGYRPMPGITSVRVQTQGKLGSIRSAEIQIKVWDKAQLDIIDALYFKLGYSMLLEWGNTCYYPSDSDQLKWSEDHIIDPFKMGWTKENLLNEISKNVFKSEGNYDAMLGIVTNFNFSYNQEGGYDCSIKLLSLGVLISEMKMNNPRILPNIQEETVKRLVNTLIALKQRELKKEGLASQTQQEKSPSDIQQYSACLRNRPGAKLKELGFPSAKFKYGIEYSINGITRYYYVDNTYHNVGATEAGSWSCDQNGNLIVAGVNQDTTAKTEYTEQTIQRTIDDIRKTSDPNIDYYVYFPSDKKTSSGPYYPGSDLYSLFLLEARNPTYKKALFINNLSALIPDSSTGLKTEVKVKLDYDKILRVYNLNSDTSKFTDAKNWRGATLGFYIYNEIDYTSTLAGQDLSYNIETQFDWEMNPVNGSVNTKKVDDNGNVVKAKVPKLDIGKSPTSESLLKNKQTIVNAIIKFLSNPDALFSVKSIRLTNLGIGTIQPIVISLEGSTQVNFDANVTLENYVSSDKLVTGEQEIQNLPYKVPFRVEFTDTSLIQGIQSTSKIVQPKNFVNYVSPTKIAQEKAPVQENLVSTAAATIAEEPVLNVSDIQKSESLKYKSAFEVMIRTIQLYSLDNALTSNIESDLKIKQLELYEPKTYKDFTKPLFSTGMFSSMLDQFLNNSESDWEKLCAEYDSNAINGFSKDSDLMLLVRAYFGFHMGLSSNLVTATELFKNRLNTDYKYLLTTYTVPYDMPVGVLEGTQINHPVYVNLGLVVMILNHICMMYDSDSSTTANRPMVYIDFNNKTNLCLSNSKQLSTNPYEILIPFYGSNKDFESIIEPTVLGYDPKGTAYIRPVEGSSTPTKVFTPRPPEGSSESDGVFDRLSGALPPYKIVGTEAEAYRGRTMNILINTEYLLRQVASYSKRNGSGDTYVKEFLEQILFDVNKYLGDINTFRLAYDDNSNTIHIIDDQYTPNLDNKYLPESNKSIIPIFGLGSIARSLEIRTEITSRLSNMLAISANADVNNLAGLSKSSDSYGIYNVLYKDRYIPNRTEYVTNTNLPTDAMINSSTQFNESIKTFYSSCTPAESSVSHATNYYIQRMSKIKTAEKGTRASAMIPVSLNFSTDGISGLGMGYAFAVPEQFLPYTYNQTFDDNGVPDRLHKVGFVMVGLDQVIENNQWTSNVRANMIYLKKRDDFAYDISKPAAAQGFTPSEESQFNESQGGGSSDCGSCEERKKRYQSDPNCSRRQSGTTVGSFSFSSMGGTRYKQDNSVSSPNRNVGGMKKIVGVVIHHSAGSLASDISIMKNGKVSYHTIVGKDGTNYNFVAESDRAWHAGCSYIEHPNIPGGSTCDDVNAYFLGLAFEGAPNFVGKGGTEPITEIEIDSAAKWIVDKIKRHGMPTDLSTIVTHGVVSCGRKDDVVKSVELAIKNRIKQLL